MPFAAQVPYSTRLPPLVRVRFQKVTTGSLGSFVSCIVVCNHVSPCVLPVKLHELAPLIACKFYVMQSVRVRRAKKNRTDRCGCL